LISRGFYNFKERTDPRPGQTELSLRNRTGSSRVSARRNRLACGGCGHGSGSRSPGRSGPSRP